MKTERSNVEFPMWRKKVDDSLLNDYMTPIPNWLSNKCMGLRIIYIKFKKSGFSQS